MQVFWEVSFKIASRVVLTSKCNFRCFFCHNEGISKKLESDLILSSAQFKKVLEEFKSLGCSSVAFTGGEPLLASSFEEMVKVGSEVFSPSKVFITTNATLLHKKLPFLKKLGLKRLYISLHSLDPKKFKFVTGEDRLGQVIKNIDFALKNKMELVINMVLIKGINTSAKSLREMFEFCQQRGVRLNLLRLYPINSETRKRLISCRVIRKRLEKMGLQEELPIKFDFFPYTRYHYKDLEIHLRDFIPKKTNNVCSICPFLKKCTEGLYYPRVTPDGKLRPCLWRSDADLDLINSLKNDTLRSDLKKFLKIYNKYSRPWVRVDA